MKNDKTPWNSLGLLIGVVVAIMALAQGRLRTGLLIAVFALWGMKNGAHQGSRKKRYSPICSVR